MSAHDDRRSARPEVDPLLAAAAEYVTTVGVASDRARETARLCLRDALACAFRALQHPACTKLLGPVVPGATMPGGARVPGTSYELDPVHAAFNIGTMIRWPGFDAAGRAADWGHPADNLGGILAVADWLARRAVMEGRPPVTVGEVLAAQIRACEIQSALALEDAFAHRGPDHAILVRVATAAVVTAMLGGTRGQVFDALSNGWIEGEGLHGFRDLPQPGSHGRRATADATSRGVRLALLAMTGERDCPPSSPQAFGGRAMEELRPEPDYPRRAQEFTAAVAACFGSRQSERIEALFADAARLEALPVTAFMATLVKN